MRWRLTNWSWTCRIKIWWCPHQTAVWSAILVSPPPTGGRYLKANLGPRQEVVTSCLWTQPIRNRRAPFLQVPMQSSFTCPACNAYKEYMDAFNAPDTQLHAYCGYCGSSGCGQAFINRLDGYNVFFFFASPLASESATYPWEKGQIWFWPMLLKWHRCTIRQVIITSCH